MKLNIGIVLLLLTLTVQVMADGKMYWKEKIPPSIPYQRALILFKDGTETLVLQSKYEIPKIESNAPLGWVVPVPAEPQLASMPADQATHLFWFLSRVSRPEVTHIIPFVVGVLLIITAVLSILIIAACILSSVITLPSWFMRNKSKLERNATYGLLVCLIPAIFFFLLTPLGVSPGVDVIKEQRVGIFDVKVVKSDNSTDLIAWLNKNNFKFGNEDKAGFDSYIARGWCFVVANIKPDKEQKASEIVSEGLAAPLILRFPVKAPVYPVALTGTGNHNTEILIYLAAASKMTCGDRLTMRYAGNSLTFEKLTAGVEPEGFFTGKELSVYSYLCKFRDVLTPAKMAQDITFSPASDNTPYREHIITW